MTLNDYAEQAMRTARPLALWQHDLTVAALGLTGESGEVADLIKKTLAQGHPLSVKEVAAEVGDVLWYCALMARAIGVSLNDIAAANIEKLKKRYPQGFSTEASMARADKAGDQ